MNESMTEAELTECRLRAEAATAGPLYVSRDDRDSGDITYEVVCGGTTLAFVPEDTRGDLEYSDARADAIFWSHSRADVLRLLDTVEARNQRKPLEFERLSNWAYRAPLLPTLGVWLWVDYVTPQTHNTSRTGWVFRLLGLGGRPTLDFEGHGPDITDEVRAAAEAFARGYGFLP